MRNLFFTVDFSYHLWELMVYIIRSFYRWNFIQETNHVGLITTCMLSWCIFAGKEKCTPINASQPMKNTKLKILFLCIYYSIPLNIILKIHLFENSWRNITFHNFSYICIFIMPIWITNGEFYISFTLD